MRHAFTLTLLLVLAAVPATADTIAPTQARLPSGMTSGVGVWAGDAMYVFGGYDWDAPDGPGRARSTIARYDPAVGAVTVMDAQLPHGGWNRPAVWTGSKVYLFGGNGYSDYLRDIVEFDPATDTARLLATQLPQRTQGAAAVWSGSYVYVLGGDPYDVGAMFRFDPATETLTRLPHTLPDGYGRFASGVWYEGAAYLVGGYEEGARRVLRVDPETGAVAVLPHELRSMVYAPALALDGSKLYLMGGAGWDEVTRVDLATGDVAIMPGRVPGGGGEVMAWDGDAAHVFVGAGCWPRDRCERAYAYVPQETLERPVVTVSKVEYSLWQTEDGSWDAGFWADVTTSGAPIYHSRMLASPAPQRGGDERLALLGITPPHIEERETIDWFQVPRHEVGTLGSLLYVLHDAPPLPRACLRMVADSGNTAFGDVSSQPVCVDVSSVHPAS